GWSLGPSQLLLGAGIACNAAVTLANGGFMPVSTNWKGKGPARSLWVQRQSGQRLLLLADNFGNRFVRFSVGDVFLAIGIVISFFGFYEWAIRQDSRDLAASFVMAVMAAGQGGGDGWSSMTLYRAISLG